MDSYIVRIYRRKRDNHRVLVGLVEEVGTKGKKAFNDLDDLWKILNSKERDRELSRWRKKQRAQRGKVRRGDYCLNATFYRVLIQSM